MDLAFEDITFANQPGEIVDEEEYLSSVQLTAAEMVPSCDNGFTLGPAPPSRKFSARSPSKGRDKDSAESDGNKDGNNSSHVNTYPQPFRSGLSTPLSPLKDARGYQPTEPTDNQAVLAAIPLPEIAQAICSRGFILLPRDATDDFLLSQGLVRISHLSEGERVRLGIPQPHPITPASSLFTTTTTTTPTAATAVSVSPSHVRNASTLTTSNNGGLVTGMRGGNSASTSTTSTIPKPSSPSSPRKRNPSAANLSPFPTASLLMQRQTSKKRKSSKTSTLDITGRPEGFPAPSGLSDAIMDSILRQQEAKRTRIPRGRESY